MEWRNIISTFKKVGNELVIMDQDGTYVLMSLKRFNELLDQSKKDVRHLSEDELIEQINRQVADWRANQEATQEVLSGQSKLGNTLKTDVDDDTFYIESVE